MAVDVRSVRSQVSEVDLLEFGLVLVDGELVDLCLQSCALLVDGVQLFSLGAHNLILDHLSEVKVLNQSLLGLAGDLEVSHGLGGLFFASLLALFALQGHTDLAELEEDLEVGEEGDSVPGLTGVRDFVEECSLFTLRIHVHLVSLLADPLLLVLSGVALLDGHLEGDLVLEVLLAVMLPGGLDVAGQELGDNVEDGLAVGASALVNGQLDFFQAVVVAGLGELGLVLLHAGDKLVHVAELLDGGAGLALLGEHLVLLVLKSHLLTLLLLPDL